MKVLPQILCVLFIITEMLSNAVPRDTKTNNGSHKGSMPALAIDCTFTKGRMQGKSSTFVSKVTLVDEDRRIIYDTKVKPIFHRIRDTNFKEGEEFNVVKETIEYITSCRLLVGHNLNKILKLFEIHHPLYLLRDTKFFYSSCKNRSDIKHSLKTLSKKLLDLDIEVHEHDTVESARVAMQIYKMYQQTWETHILDQHKTAFALDCEMVECERSGRIKIEVVAKLTIVDHLGDVIYDKIFKPEFHVSSYRFFVTGLRRKNFTDAVYLSDERERLVSLLDGNIVVGHAVGKDLSLLGIHHPFPLIRDSSTYNMFCNYFPHKKTPSLKELVHHLLNMTIQRGYHDSIEDAHASMMLYLKYRKDWDEQVNKIANIFVGDLF